MKSSRIYSSIPQLLFWSTTKHSEIDSNKFFIHCSRLSTLAEDAQPFPVRSGRPMDLEHRKHLEIGVSEFIGGLPKLAALVKHVPHDFHVHEIDKNGRIVTLTDSLYADSDDMDNEGNKSTFNQHIHFTMYKYELEHSAALNFIAQELRIPYNVIRVAGRKDKMSVSTQRVSIPNIMTIDDIISISKGWDRIRLGGFTYSPYPLTLGTLKGNHFKIILRDIQPTSYSQQQKSVENTVEETMKGLGQNGFVNYFGVQRCAFNAPNTGTAMLKKDWKQALDYILAPKSTDSDHIARAKSLWASGHNPARIIRVIPAWFQESSDERIQIFRIMASDYNKGGLSAVFQKIPTHFQSLYILSFTSYLWNHVVSYRLRKYGHQLIPGDVVYLPPGWADKTSSTGLNHPPINHTFNSKHVKILTKEDLQRKHSYSIFNVVLPVLGTLLNRHPNPDLQNYYEELLAKSGLGPNCLEEFQKSCTYLDMPYGFYRYIVVRPENINFNLLSYNYNLSQYVPSDMDNMRGGKIKSSAYGPEGKRQKHGLAVEFSLGTSSYATMALREIIRTANFDSQSLTV